MDRRCTSCGTHEFYARGLCKKCYSREWNGNQYRENKEIISAKRKQWRESHPTESKSAQTKARRKRGVMPMSENKQCGAYLGVHVAEKVLSKVFKNVISQPNNTPGFDFICGRGFKVDVKSSCTRIEPRCSNSWNFHIRKNKIADYFLCLAFDNREDLNPMHIWLIPGEAVNYQTGASIAESRITKWDEYKLDISKTIICCNNMKEASK